MRLLVELTLETTHLIAEVTVYLAFLTDQELELLGCHPQVRDFLFVPCKLEVTFSEFTGSIVLKHAIAVLKIEDFIVDASVVPRTALEVKELLC